MMIAWFLARFLAPARPKNNLWLLLSLKPHLEVLVDQRGQAENDQTADDEPPVMAIHPALVVPPTRHDQWFLDHWLLSAGIVAALIVGYFVIRYLDAKYVNFDEPEDDE